MVNNAKTRGPRRGLLAGLIALVIVLLLALLAILLYALAPDLAERIGLRQPGTPESQLPSPTATVPSPTPAPTDTPTLRASPTPEPGTLSSEDYDELLAQADALVLRSKFDDAIAIYSYLARQRPGLAQPHIGLAWAFLFDLDSEQALSHAQQAAELEPSNAEAAAVLARAYLAIGNKSQAVLEAENAVRLSPQGAVAHAALAEAYLATGQFSDALAEANLALQQDPDNPEAKSTLARLYVLDDELEQAVAELQRVTGSEPELWLRWHDLGLLLMEAQTYDAAIDAFEHALALRPKGITYSAIGQTYYESLQYDKAAVSLEKAVDMGVHQATTYGLLAMCYARLSRCEDATAKAQQALRLDPAQSLAQEANRLCAAAAAGPTPARASPTAKPAQPGTSLSGRIAFPVWNLETGKYDVYTAKASDGSDRRLVASEAHQPAFSPDGRWLAVNGERPNYVNLLLVRDDGSNLMEITPFAEDGQPAWSPAGGKLAIGSYRHGDKQSRIFILDDIPWGGGKVEGRSLSLGTDDIRGQMPSWTSDGRIVYQGCRLESPRLQCLGTGLYIVSAQPGAQTPKPLTEHPDDSAPAVWGDRIAFMSGRDGDWEIYIMNLDGSALMQLTHNGSQDGLPTWSPDGKTLAFVSDQDGAWAVWAMNPDGTRLRKLFAVGGGGLGTEWPQEQISWGP